MNEMNEKIEQVKSNSTRCLDIFLGKRPDTDCAQCMYKDLGVNCVFALIAAQEQLIKELEQK